MNERIQELAEQAIANVRFWKGCNQESYGVDEHELAKFAELIVRECARVADDSNQLKNRAVGVSVGDVVLKNFGVE